MRPRERRHLRHVGRNDSQNAIDVATGLRRAAVDPVRPAMQHAVGQVGVQGDGHTAAVQHARVATREDVVGVRPDAGRRIYARRARPRARRGHRRVAQPPTTGRFPVLASSSPRFSGARLACPIAVASSAIRSRTRSAESCAPVIASHSVKRPGAGTPAKTLTTARGARRASRLQQSSTASSRCGESRSSGASGSHTQARAEAALLASLA